MQMRLVIFLENSNLPPPPPPPFTVNLLQCPNMQMSSSFGDISLVNDNKKNVGGGGGKANKIQLKLTIFLALPSGIGDFNAESGGETALPNKVCRR